MGMGAASRQTRRAPGTGPPDLKLVLPAAERDECAIPVTLIVVAPGGGADLAGCLEALADQEDVDGVDVIVVDRPSERSAETARSHPVVNRVLLGTHAVSGALVGRALWSVRAGVVGVLSPAARPGPRWLRDALDSLGTGADAAWAPTATDAGVLVDLVSLRTAWWRDGIPRIPPGDSPHDVRRWLAAAGLWCVDASRLPSDRYAAAPPTVPPTSAPTPPYAGTISVVVCSHGRPDALARCLASLQLLDDADHELIVVDNGLRPQYDPASIAAVGGRHVHEPRRGLDHARNRGYREAVGDVIAYVDDDCEVDRGWLAGVRHAMADPAVGLMAGRVVPASLALPSERWFEAWFGFDRGTLPDRCTRDDTRPWASFYPSVLGTGANMAYRRALLEEIGGFDVLLDVGSSVGGGGDIDAFARVLDTGAVGCYEPSAVVVHHHRTDMRSLRRQFFGYGQALGAVCVKYALDRPGHKRSAVRFYRERLRDQRRGARVGRQRLSEIPLSLTLIEIAGQLHGPFAYLLSRRRALRR